MFFNRMKNIDVEAICSCFDTMLHMILMIAYKVFSMTFPYIATLLLLQLFMKHFYDFSIIDIPSVDHQTCQSSMWRNILFIDQFYPLHERVSFLLTACNCLNWLTIDEKTTHHEYLIPTLLFCSFFFLFQHLVHGLVMDFIGWIALLCCDLHHFTHFKKSSTIRPRYIQFISNQLTDCKHNTSILWPSAGS